MGVNLLIKNSKKNQCREPVSIHVESLSHDGRGVGRFEGKTVFVDGALPQEDVRVQIKRQKRSYDEGGMVEIIKPSPFRVEARCPHFGVCGGCSLQHMEPQAQIDAKQKILIDNLQRIGNVTPARILDPVIGSFWGYRHKARLGVKYVAKKEAVLVGFREKRNSLLAELSGCEVLHPSVGKRIDALRLLIKTLSVYTHIPQIEVAVGDNGTALVFRHLIDVTDQDKALLVQFGKDQDVQIYLQPKGLNSVTLLWPDDAKLHYSLPEFKVELEFKPTDFIQINAQVNRKMVSLVVSLLELQTADTVLDLFCGIGNFTLPIARHAATVVGVEGDAELVLRAGKNALRNGIDNCQFIGADLSKDPPDSNWYRKQGYDKILIDPPRVGALDLMNKIPRMGAKRVVYVSCNPATLARDAGELVHKYGYVLSQVGVLDMFPHTTHVESIALFELR